MWKEYICASKISEVLTLLDGNNGQARIVAGATDLLVELKRDQRMEIKTLIDITRIPNLDRIWMDKEGMIHIGPAVTHNQCVHSNILREHAVPLCMASWQVGSPQVRNRGTIAGNLVTASPANDTIPPLMALGAEVLLQSKKGERVVSFNDFFRGVRKTDLQSDEMLVDIRFPAMATTQKGIFLKFGLRRAQAISVANIAVVLNFDGKVINSACITLGSVAPTVVYARQTAQYLVGRRLTQAHIDQAALIAQQEIHPIDDIRGSADFRAMLVTTITRQALENISKGGEKKSLLPDDPVLLWGRSSGRVVGLSSSARFNVRTPLKTTINGKLRTAFGSRSMTLLQLLRDEFNLVGTKEGCGEGECGACTVYMDGMAVLACLVPAPRAHGAMIETIEELASNGKLHPLQKAFIDEGAVQCGYCTPGFIMAGASLLDEKQAITEADIRNAISGNLCRCTGYYKIIKAIEKAAATARLT